MPIESTGHHKARLVVFWVVLIIAATISTVNLIQILTINTLSHRTEKAICVEVLFLEGSAARNQVLINENPGDAGNNQRRAAISQTNRLAKDLRATGVKCGRLR